MPAYRAEWLLEGVVWRILDACMESLDILPVSHPESRGCAAAEQTAFDWVLMNGMDAAVESFRNRLLDGGQYPLHVAGCQDGEVSGVGKRREFAVVVVLQG